MALSLKPVIPNKTAGKSTIFLLGNDKDYVRLLLQVIGPAGVEIHFWPSSVGPAAHGRKRGFIDAVGGNAMYFSTRGQPG